MKVGFDVTQAAKRKGRGIARYIRALLPELVDAMPELEPVLHLRDQRWWRRELVADLLPGAERRPLLGPLASPRRDLDHFHSLGNHLPWLCPAPRSFTLHDLRALDLPSRRPFATSRVRSNMRRARGVVVLTEYGKSRLLHHFPEFPERRVEVVPQGVDLERFIPRAPEASAAFATSLGLNLPFLLQVGSWFRHKNLELSIRAFARSQARDQGFQLAFVGGGAPSAYAASLRELAASEGVADSIHWLGNVTGEQLPQLFSAASALLQPSFYEGFGLPVLEAMAAGTPGVVAEASCLPEVAGKAWPSAPPDDADAFAAALDKMAMGGPERERAISLGLKRAQEFSWRRTAEATAAFLRRFGEA